MAAQTKSIAKLSANITITETSPVHNVTSFPTVSSSIDVLYPALNERTESDADRYFTASSGDEKYDDDDDDFMDDDDEDNDDMCIMLDSDDEDADVGSLSGLHIDLKTLQAVSNMLAHYIPIIQRDSKGKPIFVAPPPPSFEYMSPNLTPQKEPEKSPKRNDVMDSPVESDSNKGSADGSPLNPGYETVKHNWNREVEEFEMALQELENVITAEEDNFLADNMSALVMDSMTYCAAEEVDNI